MCVDANTGCPYYWDQITNQVLWELPSGVAVPTTPIIPPGIIQSFNICTYDLCYCKM